ncbi:Fe-S cluster assembly protein DRE2 [Mycena chlorophos]|uniref:Fe-S cluster assembly protein DRE2 n=1 Tax=Mycena chlorophos TaxID=658473 RepID=A0A8H6WG39_MYCCL|nr:Fe-S cluster assembly protein DRE2 [Mycena chlorophos]
MSAPDVLDDAATEGNYYQDSPNDSTGGLPINLDSLRDGPPGTKPFYPYSTLIRYAIKGSPSQKLLLEDIYYAIESRFPYFRTAPNGWKNSVRHNLSLNPCFQKEARPLTDRGKGSYWIVNDDVDPRTGVHRIRKRKPKSGKSRASPEEQDVDFEGGNNAEASGSAPGPAAFEEAAYQVQVPPPLDENGQPLPYPPPFPGFMPPLMDVRFSTPLVVPVEDMIKGDNGETDWRAMWAREIGHLQQITAEQDKNGAKQEWYQMMLVRVRSALLLPPTIDPEILASYMPGGPMDEDGQQDQQQAETVVPEETS